MGFRIAAGVMMLCAGLIALTGRAAAQQPTPHIDAVAQALRVDVPGTENLAWFQTHNNELRDNWLLQTPGCWGENNCVPSGSNELIKTIREDVANAKRLVDITSMFPAPNGGFEDAIIAGLKASIAAGQRPTVRVIVGATFARSLQPWQMSARNYRDELVNKLGLGVDPLPITVAFARTKWPFSWNHAKILSVDGESIITGGHNYWDKDYLAEDPVSDVSFHVHGPAALAAHRYTDLLWKNTCDHASGLKSITRVDLAKTASVSACPRDVALAPMAARGDVAMLAVSQLGLGLKVVHHGSQPPAIAEAPVQATCGMADHDVNHSTHYQTNNPGPTALRALICSARKSVFLSQQDVLGKAFLIESKFDERLFAILGRKILDHVPVTIVLSTPGAKGGAGSSYSNGEALQQTAKLLTKEVRALANTSQESAKAAVCSDLKLATLRVSANADWDNGAHYANHAKIVSVDDEAFYIGSQNLYPARLQEWGYIVENAGASETFRKRYIDPLWRWSAAAAISDPERHLCF